MQRMAQRKVEALARLRVILQVLQLGFGNVQLLPGEDRLLPRFVVVELASVNGEAKGERAVKEIRFGEAERQRTLDVSNLRLHRQRLAQAEEVVGAVVHPDERAFKSAHAAGKADA